MKSIASGFLFLTISLSARSQNEGADLLRFEQSIDDAVVACNIPFLQKVYADDFRFKHGTGLVDSKASWLKNVQELKGKFISRAIDSVEVEIHGTIGITNGRLSVHRYTDTGESRYIIKFVRVYLRKGKDWQMIMHRTVDEKHIH
jgi:hypothetical protein